MTKVLFSLFLLCVSITISGFRTKDTSLVVKISNLASTEGKIYLLVYDQQIGFPTNPDKALRKVEAKIANTSPEVLVTALPFGKYAIVAFHDKNANGTFDKSWWGSPKEAYGFSNLPSEFCGTPSFQQTAIIFDAAHSTTTIKLMQP